MLKKASDEIMKSPQKRALFFVAPSYFLLTGYKARTKSPRFLESAAKLLASSLDPEEFVVDLYQFDARLIKHFTKIEDCITQIPELYYPDLFIEYLKGNIYNKRICEILECIDDGFVGYDYILCVNPRDPAYEIAVLAGNNLSLIIMQYLARKNPGAQKIYGGKRSHYFEWEKLRQKGIDLSELVDLAVYGQIPYQSINQILKEKVVVGGAFYSRDGSYTFAEPSVKQSIPPLDYSKPRNLLRNREDMRYTYKYIFDDLCLEIPDPAKESNYIQQAAFYYMGGCIGKCAFCSTGVSPPKFDAFERTTEFINIYVNELGYNSFFFKNATLNSNRRLVEKICNWIVQKNLKIFWSDSCRLSGNSQDFYSMLYAAGARMLCYGVDSGSDRILKYVNKGSTVEEMSCELSYAHKAGIWNLVNVIGGYPYETLDEVNLTIKFLQDHLEYINVLKFNVFHLEPMSPFSWYPDKYDLTILSRHADSEKFFESMRNEELRYAEKNGRTWEEIQIFRKSVRAKVRETHAFRKQKFMTHISQHLLFALYDMLGTKYKVEHWLDTNYRIGRRAYYEKYKNQPKIESWESHFELFPNFQNQEDTHFIFPGTKNAEGHSKLGDKV